MLKLITDYNPSPVDNSVIRTGIALFNDKKLGYESKAFSVFLRDENNKIHGGVLAWLEVESVYVDILWIDEAFRSQGYGTRLLKTTEEEAIKNGCSYCTLDTFGFQAEDFYLKNGYEHIGEVKNYIRNYSRIFLRKKLF